MVPMVARSEAMSKQWKRYNLYVPEEDGEEILRRARIAAANTGQRFNSWVFSALRQVLGMPEPTKAKRARRKAH